MDCGLQTDRWVDKHTHRYLLLETVCALLAFGLQQAAGALRPGVGVGGHHNLVAVNHALVAVVLGVGGRKRGLVGCVGGVGGVGVVLGLVSRWRNGHGQTAAGVRLDRGLNGWMGKRELVKPSVISL